METIVNRERIEKQAKEIIDKFAFQLEKVEKEINEESYVERDEFERVEGNGINSDSLFKEDILKNAPNHDDNFIIAEKGSFK